MTEAIPAETLRISQVTMEVRPYRLGFYGRISRRPGVTLKVYSGHGPAGYGSPEDLPNVPVPVCEVKNIFWPGRPLKVLWQRGALRVLRDDTDVIVLQEIVSNLSVWAIRMLHRRYGKALVLMGFFYRPDSGAWWEPLRAYLRKYLRKTAGSFLAYTERGRHQLVKENIDPDKVFVSNNTLDTARLAALARSIGEEKRREIRNELGLTPGTFVLAFLGRIRPIKRVEVAVEAVRLVAQQVNQPCALLVIGGGEGADRLKSGLKGAPVVMVGQTYDESVIAEYLSVSSLMVLPGSVGLTCVHGFANGLPCLTTRDDATEQTPEYEYVVHGVNGLIIDSPDAESYAAAIVRLMSDGALLDSLREGAWKSAEQLDMDRMATAFVDSAWVARCSVPDGGASRAQKSV